MKDLYFKFQKILEDTIGVLPGIIMLIAGTIAIVLIIIISSRTPYQQANAELHRKIKICYTFSDNFWKSDVEFIDGKCYYKGGLKDIK